MIHCYKLTLKGQTYIFKIKILTKNSLIDILLVDMVVLTDKAQLVIYAIFSHEYMYVCISVDTTSYFFYYYGHIHV